MTPILIAILIVSAPDASERTERPAAEGTRGLHRVEAAQGVGDGALLFTLSGRYFRAKNFLETGDDNERQIQTLSLVWGPFEGLDLVIRQRFLTNNNALFEPRTVQILGDPSVGAKYSHALSDRWGVGGVIRLLLPTAPRGSGLEPSAFRLTTLLTTTLFLPSLRLSANMGYVVDHTDNLFTQDVGPVQRFTAGTGEVNRFSAGVGIASDFALARDLKISPFVEATGEYASSVAGSRQPIRITAGGKLFPTPGGWIDFILGGDFRINGDGMSSRLPGTPPWEIFGQVTARLGMPEAAAEPSARPPTPCKSDSECLATEQCQENFCQIAPVIPVEPLPPTFVVLGQVVDAASGDAIPNASITFSDSEASALRVDPETGKFQSFGLEISEGLLQVQANAPGYKPSTVTLSRDGSDLKPEVLLKLTQLGVADSGQIKGSLKNARTGAPVVGKIFVPNIGRRLKTDKKGRFSATLREGDHPILISAPGYRTQKKRIKIRKSDVVILNLDMVPLEKNPSK